MNSTVLLDTLHWQECFCPQGISSSQCTWNLQRSKQACQFLQLSKTQLELPDQALHCFCISYPQGSRNTTLFLQLWQTLHEQSLQQKLLAPLLKSHTFNCLDLLIFIINRNIQFKKNQTFHGTVILLHNNKKKLVKISSSK